MDAAGGRGLFLDLDGTLADSMSVMKSVYLRFLGDHGISGGDAEFDSLVGPPLAEVIATLQDTHSLPGDLDDLVRTYGELIDQFYREVKPCAGARNLLETAKQAGWVIGVVTSSSRARAEGWIAAVGFSDYVSLVVGGDDVERGKPSPEPYLTALQRAGCEAARSVAVEDSPQGAAAAVAAGLGTFAVNATGVISGVWPATVKPVSGLADLVTWLVQMTMQVFPLRPNVKFVVTGAAPALPEALGLRVEEIWEAEQRRRPGELTNGLIYCIESHDAGKIRGHFEEYKRVIGQILDAEVAEALNLWSLGVSGILQCRDGLVFGLRGNSNTYDQGMWELVPSGGVDDQCFEADGNADPKAQVVAELTEEIGLLAEEVRVGEPFLLIKNIDDHYFDMGLELTTNLDGPAILDAYANLDNDEYTELKIVPVDEVGDFVAAHPGRMVGVSIIYLRHKNWLT